MMMMLAVLCFGCSILDAQFRCLCLESKSALEFTATAFHFYYNLLTTKSANYYHLSIGRSEGERVGFVRREGKNLLHSLQSLVLQRVTTSRPSSSIFHFPSIDLEELRLEKKSHRFRDRMFE